MPSPLRLHWLLGAGLAVLGTAAPAMDLALDDIDTRLSYVDTPGLSTITRSGSTAPSGTPTPGTDGTLHPTQRRGFSIEGGVFVASRLSRDQEPSLGWMAGLSLFDTIRGGTFAAGTGGPGGSGVTKEDLDAFGVKLHLGSYLRYHRMRLELLPFGAIGPSRGTYYASFTPDSAEAELFGTQTEVHSDIGTFYDYGIQLGAFYAPAEPGSFLAGVGIGWESFRSTVTFPTNATTGGATDRLAGHGLDLVVSAGGTF